MDTFELISLIKVAILFTVQFTTGILVSRYNIRVNYTRKINHLSLFFTDPFLYMIFQVDPVPGAELSAAIGSMLFMVIYIAPIRSRVPFIKMMFTSFDRPEDRPYTLLWMVTQLAAGYIVLVPLSMYLNSIGYYSLISIPIFINGLGDGLAEPVGIRFGKHKYQTRALFSDKKFTRSYEGSAMVFLASIVILMMFQSFFSPIQFVVALIVIPILMTLAEAFSPHTWDAPFLFLTGGCSLVMILQIT